MYISCIRFSWDRRNIHWNDVFLGPRHELACGALVPPSGICPVGCLVDVVNFVWVKKKDLM